MPNILKVEKSENIRRDIMSLAATEKTLSAKISSLLNTKFNKEEIVKDQPEVSKYVKLLPKEQESCSRATD